jgi:hypothetical protein
MEKRLVRGHAIAECDLTAWDVIGCNQCPVCGDALLEPTPEELAELEEE